MATERIPVAVRGDFVEKETKGKPIPALCQLIWNALDADATKVSVELEHNDLAGGLSRIAVYDDGTGFARSQAPVLFGALGGSWKRLKRETAEKQRPIHGQEGKGRYKAFALGQSVTWRVVHGKESAERQSFAVELNSADLGNVSISDAESAPDAPRGVTVDIRDIIRDFRVFENEESLQELAETFALYLVNHSDVRIEIAGVRVDPANAILRQETFPLPMAIQEDGATYHFDLHLIEWKSETKRTLYLCTETGLPLEQVETRFQIPGYSFSAYLRSAYITKLEKDGRLELAGLDPALNDAVDLAKDTIKSHFRARAAEAAQSVVDRWKEDDIYPFSGDATSAVEVAERQIFDIVASEIQQFTPDLRDTPNKAQKLHLRMLRNAIERGPEELQLILREVLDLPVRKQKELAALLQETTLSAIITAAKTVADRLKFIDALESIVFDTETKKRLKERTQLHRILAENTWVFGEEYNLWVSDQGLRKVLEKHSHHLDKDIKIEDPVKIYGQKIGIVDLMFSRTSRRHRADDIEHLVVELKAPKVNIGADEIVQAKKYQLAVSSDERFQTVKGVRWHFVLVSNAYDEYARNEINGGPDADRRLITKTGNATVAIKTWGEIIEENRARLQFFQEKLQTTADESQAIQYLRDRHSALLKGVFEEDASAVEEGAPDNPDGGDEADEEGKAA